MATSIVDHIKSRGAPRGWEETFKKAEAELALVSKVIHEKFEDEYFPLQEDLFKAFDMCSLDNVKCVILGQDPYHTIGPANRPQANGMCFSTHGRIQPSLLNIYKELKREYGDEYDIPDNGDLSGWAAQGVLLLNTCLTVRPGAPLSHGSIWIGFITRVLAAIAEKNSKCIYLLWGGEAQKFALKIPDSSIKLRASHPSPYSAARRGGPDNPAFNECGHFKLVNQYLEAQGKALIKWQFNSSS